MPVNFPAKYLCHTPQGSLTCRKNLRHWGDGFTSSPKEVAIRIFIAFKKIRRPRSGLNPRILSPMTSTMTNRPTYVGVTKPFGLNFPFVLTNISCLYLRVTSWSISVTLCHTCNSVTWFQSGLGHVSCVNILFRLQGNIICFCDIQSETKHRNLVIIFWKLLITTSMTSQIRHLWDQTGAGPDNFPNHRWLIYYGTKTPK
jgi:hypothetical protein